MAHWRQLPSPPWLARSFASVAVLPDGAVLLLAGKGKSRNETHCLNDIWRSNDGGNSWNQLPSPPWPARRQASVAVLSGGSVLLLGGESADGRLLADVWRSDDGGFSWYSLPSPAWPARWQACAIVLQSGTVVLLAGEAELQDNNDEVKRYLQADAWRSDDGGRSWQELPRPPWTPRCQACVATIPGDVLILLAGRAGTQRMQGNWSDLGDAWRSIDGGMSWQQLDTQPWLPRRAPCLATLPHGELVLLAGYSYDVFRADAWSSVDGGDTWCELPASRQGRWPGRMGAGVAVLPNGVLLLLGGHGEKKVLNDVWCSCGSDEREPEMNDMETPKRALTVAAQGEPTIHDAPAIFPAANMPISPFDVGTANDMSKMRMPEVDRFWPEIDRSIESPFARTAGTYELGDAVEYFHRRHELWMPANIVEIDCEGGPKTRVAEVELS